MCVLPSHFSAIQCILLQTLVSADRRCRRRRCCSPGNSCLALFPAGLQRVRLVLHFLSFFPSFLLSDPPFLPSLTQNATQQLRVLVFGFSWLSFTHSEPKRQWGWLQQAQGRLSSLCRPSQASRKSAEWAGRACHPLGCAIPLCSASWSFPQCLGAGK